MQKALNEMNLIPGVMGGYVYNPEMGVIEKNLPSIFKEEKLREISSHLIKLNQLFGTDFPDHTDAFLFFEQSAVTIREIESNFFFVLLSDPKVKANMLSVSINLIIEELKPLIREYNPQDKAASSSNHQRSEKKESSIDPKVLEEMMNSGPLSDPLTKLKALMVKILGPVAPVMFKGALEKWCETQTPSTDTMPLLVDLLCREMGDGDFAEEFRKGSTFILSQ